MGDLVSGTTQPASLPTFSFFLPNRFSRIDITSSMTTHTVALISGWDCRTLELLPFAHLVPQSPGL